MDFFSISGTKNEVALAKFAVAVMVNYLNCFGSAYSCLTDLYHLTLHLQILQGITINFKPISDACVYKAAGNFAD